MTGIKAVADNIMKQSSLVQQHLQNIMAKTSENLALLQDKVKSILVTIDQKCVNILPGASAILKKKCKEYYQIHTYQILKMLQKDANVIQDTLCALQAIEVDKHDINIPEFEAPLDKEISIDKKLNPEQIEKIVAEAKIMEV